MSIRNFRKTLLAAAACVTSAAWAQVAVYDGTSNVLTIPSVKVGASTFVGVTLLNKGNFQFSLQGATEQIPAADALSRYDATTNVLTLPAVKVGSTTFLNVKLLNTGNFVFALQGADELDADTLAEITAFMAAHDARYSLSVPSPGNVNLATSDSCYLNEGRTKGYLVNEFDSRPAGDSLRVQAYQIGRRTSNLQVLVERNLTNSDGSSRKEIDLQYDIAFRDGTSAVATRNTLVRGSSAGTVGCTAAPTSSSAWRFFGNQHLISTGVNGRIRRQQGYVLATGAPQSTPVAYRRDVRWRMTDPMGAATHVIVTGPGPKGSVNGATQPFSLKFISPRLLRGALELQGRGGNYLNWLDDDGFQFCRIASSALPVASIADCVGQGTNGDSWGTPFTATPNAAADQGFAVFGFAGGGAYVFAVYNDDGWKTVNGHVGRLPIATYTAVLNALPPTMVEMAGGGVNSDKFPRLSFGGMSPVQIKDNLISATPAPMSVSWNLPTALADGPRFGLNQGWEFYQGAKVGNVAGAFNPAYRYIASQYPGSTATAAPSWPVSTTPAAISSKSYTEFNLQYLDRNGSEILSYVYFQ